MIALYTFLFLVIAWVDWHRRLIWHVLTVSGIGVALFSSEALPAGWWWHSIVGIIACGGLLGGIWLFSRWWFGAGRFGFGDVMLGGLIGSVFGVVTGLWVIALGMLFAGGYAIVQLWRGRGQAHVFGYGAFLAIVAALWLVM